MKRYKILFILLIISLIVTPDTAKANERYYHKGTSYTGKYKDYLNGSGATASSVVVVSASTVYTNPSGKERVRAFSRCEVITNIYKNDVCYIDEISVRLSASDSAGNDKNVTSLIQMTIPEENKKIDLSAFFWPISNVYVLGTLYSVQAIANESGLSIKHTSKSSATATRVTFKYPKTSTVDVPTSVAYNQVDKHYSNKQKGVAAEFTFQYDTTDSYKYLTAKAHVVYDIIIKNDAPYVPPLSLLVTTEDASLTHTIGR